ncbi:hypothetical protein [Plantibacter flavus]|uniref:hypothetical protein n=1 Tax=Plantibacter flavus TaxID=150123 RepID=UPI00117EF24D|nr:hypothetical protein [Plantibacter flavus]
MHPSSASPSATIASVDLPRLLVVFILAVITVTGLFAIQPSGDDTAGPSTAAVWTPDAAPVDLSPGGDTLLGGCAFDGHGRHSTESTDCSVAVPTAKVVGDQPFREVAVVDAVASSPPAASQTGRTDGPPVSLTELSISRT